MFRYCVTIFLGAFLLFVVQPLMGRLILPSFGGVAIVWTTSVLMFQILLLAGYCWAHLLRLLFAPRSGMLVHSALLIASAFLLPLALPGGLQINPDGSISLQVAWILLLSVGAPFVLLSATSPLMQAWQSASHPHSSPYRMYALSNVGSLVGLLGYPTLVESTLGISLQTQWWSIAFVVYIILLVWTGGLVWGLRDWPDRSLTEGPRPDESASAVRRSQSNGPYGNRIVAALLWIGLTAIASGLMMATSTVLCQEIASFPFLWVLPLAAYLIAWIIAFEKPEWYTRRVALLALIVTGIAGLIMWHLGANVSISIHMAVMPAVVFFGSWVCLGELERSKPPARHLTLFWMLTGVGGLVGGLLVVVVAPVVFERYYEFHFSLALAIVVGAVAISRELWLKDRRVGWRMTVCIVGSLIAISVLAVSFSMFNHFAAKNGLKFVTRTEYGLVSVWEAGGFRSIVNGQTIHGKQSLDEANRYLLTDYYARDRGIGLAVEALKRNRQDAENPANSGKIRIGLIGVGCGCLSAWAEAGDKIRLYELNPEVVKVAWNWFSWLAHAQELDTLDGPVIVGDARVRLEQELTKSGSNQFDILVVDAFTSDSIPAHLLTEECLKMYWSHMRADGIVAIHISNRNIDLRGVLVHNASDDRHQSLLFEHPTTGVNELGCTWVLIGLPDVLRESGLTAKSTPWPEDVQPIPWTDDYNCVMWLVKWKPDFAGLKTELSKMGKSDAKENWP